MKGNLLAAAGMRGHDAGKFPKEFLVLSHGSAVLCSPTPFFYVSLPTIVQEVTVRLFPCMPARLFVANIS
jgi:hypothetical protein